MRQHEATLIVYIASSYQAGCPSYDIVFEFREVSLSLRPGIGCLKAVIQSFLRNTAVICFTVQEDSELDCVSSAPVEDTILWV